MQGKIIIVLALTLATVIFIPLYWATESGREAAAITGPEFQPTAATFLSSEQGQTIFEQKCMACHSIGQGNLVGPDLKGVIDLREREWLIRFIVSPEKLIAEGDPLARQLVEEYGGIEMPNMGLSEPEAEEVLAYIDAQSGGESLTPSPAQDAEKPTTVPVTTPEAEKPAATVPATTPGQDRETPVPIPSEEPAPTEETAPSPRGDASAGRAIFTGTIALQNGGAACLSCHNINGIGALGGGAVGKDLTEAYATFGEQGLTSILRTTPFPMMTEIYAEKPLTDDENAHLLAFLQETSTSQQITSSQRPFIFIVISIVGCLIIVGVLQLIWRGRLPGVRQSLVKGGSK